MYIQGVPFHRCRPKSSVVCCPVQSQIQNKARAADLKFINEKKKKKKQNWNIFKLFVGLFFTLPCYCSPGKTKSYSAAKFWGN